MNANYKPVAVMPDWPRLEDAAPTAVYQPTPLAPASERRVIGYERYGGDNGVLIPVYEATPTSAPQTVQQMAAPDPWPKRILAIGVAAPLVGFGGSILFSALAGATTALGLVVAALTLAWLTQSGGKTGGDTYHYKINNRNTWWGKSTTRIH